MKCYTPSTMSFPNVRIRKIHVKKEYTFTGNPKKQKNMPKVKQIGQMFEDQIATMTYNYRQLNTLYATMDGKILF